MSRRSKTENSGNTVDREVANLFAIKDKSQVPNQLLALRQKYRDSDLVNKIQQVFAEKQRAIVKGAKKFADAFRKKYSSADLPYHQLLNKARAHAKKHGISEDEFAEFQRMYEQDLAGTNKANEVVLPVTNLMKVLGNLNIGEVGGFNIEEADYKNLQEILREWELYKPLHAQTLLQALQYEDLALTGLTAVIDRTQHNPGEHVHPVVAAMFYPKINLFESHFLFSNIAGIVRSRHNQEAMTTRPDYELFYNLVTDPNDIVCDNRTPLGDLLNRSRLQKDLWNSVLALRNGQVYNNSFREFVRSVDHCRLNKFDNPDFAYGRHDGTVIKRLLSAFSFRPTVVATLPVAHVFSANPYAQNTRPTVTNVPMINVRLHAYQNVPRNAIGGLVPGGVNANRQTGTPTSIALSGCLIQTQTFIEGNMLVQRVSDVVFSREVLIFYVDRRAHLLQYGSPFNISKLPSAIAGFERINLFPIELECSIQLRQGNNPDTFCLRSVVVAEVNSVRNPSTDPRSIVTGSSTFIVDWPEILDAQGNKTGLKKCGVAPANQAMVVGANAAGGPGFNQGNVPPAGAPNVAPPANANVCDSAIALYHYDPANALIKHAPYAVYDVITGMGGNVGGTSIWNTANGTFGNNFNSPPFAPVPVIHAQYDLLLLGAAVGAGAPAIAAGGVALRQLGQLDGVISRLPAYLAVHPAPPALPVPATQALLAAALAAINAQYPGLAAAAAASLAAGLAGPMRAIQNQGALPASRIPGVPPARGVQVNGLTKQEAEDRMRTQGVIFIYQNFNYNKNEDQQISI
jgi:hypothetical protein